MLTPSFILHSQDCFHEKNPPEFFFFSTEEVNFAPFMEFEIQEKNNSKIPQKDDPLIEEMCNVYIKKVRVPNLSLTEAKKFPHPSLYGPQPPNAVPMHPPKPKDAKDDVDGTASKKKKTVIKTFYGPVGYKGQAVVVPPNEAFGKKPVFVPFSWKLVSKAGDEKLHYNDSHRKLNFFVVLLLCRGKG